MILVNRHCDCHSPALACGLTSSCTSLLRLCPQSLINHLRPDFVKYDIGERRCACHSPALACGLTSPCTSLLRLRPQSLATHVQPDFMVYDIDEMTLCLRWPHPRLWPYIVLYFTSAVVLRVCNEPSSTGLCDV